MLFVYQINGSVSMVMAKLPWFCRGYLPRLISDMVLPAAMSEDKNVRIFRAGFIEACGKKVKGTNGFLGNTNDGGMISTLIWVSKPDYISVTIIVVRFFK